MALKRLSRNFTLQNALDRVDMFIGNVMNVTMELDAVKNQLKFDMMKTYGLLGGMGETLYNFVTSSVSPSGKIIDFSGLETSGLSFKRVKGVSYKRLSNDAKIYLEAESWEQFVKLGDSEYRDSGRWYYVSFGEGLVYLFQGTNVSSETSDFYLNTTRYPNVDFTDLSAKVDLPDFAIQYWLANTSVVLLQQKNANVPGFLTSEQSAGLQAITSELESYTRAMKQIGKDQNA